ncbi:MAG TPA: IS630 family transposase [Planctomycetaceae bacterium]|nr:IS630 family transposase [Planctomycetaceae bacterium]
MAKDGCIQLSEADRKWLLGMYRGSGDARLARRAHVVLLVADGRSYRDIMACLFCSAGLISDAVRDFRSGGVAAVLRDAREQPAVIPHWCVRLVEWVVHRTPQDFGYFRSRWSCALLAEVLAWETGVRISGETIRRVLQELGFLWRRPRPAVGPEDPDYAEKLARIQQLLVTLPPDETAVFQDEVDVHQNPEIGSMWMLKGRQAEVVTPGNNEKCHLAGSLVWLTGTLIASPPGARRDTALFLDHLDDLHRRLRGFRKIHVICDNAAFHKSRPVQEYLATWGHRIVLHFLPRYAPETNPIERVWWRLHETLTRNHRCQSLPELVAQVYEWFEKQRRFCTPALINYPQAA